MPVQLQGGVYYNIEEAASELGISDKQLRGFIDEGRISTVKAAGRLLIYESDLMEFKSTYKKWSKTK